ncbi:CLIP-associated protein isoform X2 [Physcomitrium patens]|nr:CLIP-associated protein-like isoform X2 [Physcomitrium patens]|eukprot:XP_024364725.1 CLIP-associated protein-like isoform X2 [Physcomitrella patens]
MYRQGGQQFGDELQRHQLRASQLKEINARFEKIEPVRNMFDSKSYSSTVPSTTTPNRFSTAPSQPKPAPQQAVTNHSWPASELKVPVSGGISRGNSPKSKPALEADEKPAEPIRIYNERDLAKEFEKATSMLAPAQDWSIRMSAMQRIEGIVAGGATKYSSFPQLLKQLISPLCDQLADRRSSIVKQACQLLKVLTKELKSDFEVFAESFLPMLFKLVVITVLVIAESADACIKSMLQHCKVARVLPKMVELAKHDRNAVLRARCCEYLLLVLERWFDSPEMQRSAELYEDLIKCCCSDAMSEVRSLSRQCYRVFARCWPDRARRLYQAFDPVTQRVINDEDGGILKKYGHSTSHNTHQLRQSTSLPILGAGHSTSPSGQSNSSDGPHTPSMNGYNTNHTLRPASSMSQRKSSESAPERSLQSVLQASQQQVNAIETMLKGVGIDDLRPYYSNSQTAVQSTFSKSHSTGATWSSRPGVDPPSSRDPPHLASGPAAHHQTSLSAFRPGSAGRIPSGHQAYGDVDAGRSADFAGISREAELAGDMSHDSARGSGRSQSAKRVPTSVPKYSYRSSNSEYDEPKLAKRIPKPEVHMDRAVSDHNSNAVPAYQRPLLRQTVLGRSSGSSRINSEDNVPTVVMNTSGEVFTYMDGLMSLNDALTEGLAPGSEWSARVAAFTFIKKLIQQGNKSLQEVNQSFEKVMKLFSTHLDDPHHKVAQAALSTLVELVPVCRKLFETYLERILPHVFARLVDAKEVIRQLSTSALETVGNTYSIDALLPALLRSLDEQRSPKAKMAVIEFAIAAFAKLALNGEASGGSGLLKLWLAKLAPLVHDKNAKLKETAVTGLISVYSHFDSSIVLNFILGLSIEEQSTLRRALKHYTPRIEVDLMIYMQNRSQRNKVKPGHERPSASSPLTEKDEDYVEEVFPTGERNQTVAGYSPVVLDKLNRKWAATAQPDTMTLAYHEGAAPSMADLSGHSYPTYTYAGDSSIPSADRNPKDLVSNVISKEASTDVISSTEITTSWFNQTQEHQSQGSDTRHNALPLVDSEGSNNLNLGFSMAANSGNPHFIDSASTHSKIENNFYHQRMNANPLVLGLETSTGVLQMSSWDSGKTMGVRQKVLQQLTEFSDANDSNTWSKYYNQFITLVFEALDDPESTIREQAASVLLQMLKNQKDRLNKDTEILLEKLLQSARDTDAKVSAAADLCLNAVLMELDTYRCLSVVVPLLESENEKTLVTCISCLTKLVSRLPPEELTSQLNSFLPMLFDAFGNQDADVRKTVVFCLVEIYIVLGKAFVPYLGSLSSTQLRLVTLYANRISQARMGSASQSTLQP